MSQCCRCVNGTCERKRCSCAKSWNSCVNCTPMKTDRCTNRLPLHTTNNATADILQTGLAPSTPLPAKTSPPASQSQSLPETSTTLATHIDTTSGDSPTPVPLLPEIEPAVLDPFSWGEGSASTGVPLSQPTPPPQPRPLQQEKKKEEEAGEVEAVSGTAVPFRPGEYCDTAVKNGASITVQCKLMSLTGMKEYDNKCYEELRCEDYQANRKGKTTGAGWLGGGLGGGLGGTSMGGAKNQPINTSHQPKSATAPIPSDFGKPSVGVMSDVGDEAESKTKAFRHMNVKISSHLTKSNLQNLKYLFLAEGIPESDSEGATSGVDLFQLLEQKGVYTPHKVSVVKKALKTLGREDLIELIMTFESDWRYEEHDGQGRQTKPQSSSTSHQPAPAIAPIPPEQRPGVGVGDEPGASKNVRFAIITANKNEWESANFFMGRGKCITKGCLKNYLTENFSDLFEADPDKITIEFDISIDTYYLVTVGGVLGVLTECSQMGSLGAGQSFDTVKKLLDTAEKKKWELEAVFLVGCCGCASQEADVLGTVLVADKIYSYDGGEFIEEGYTQRHEPIFVAEEWVHRLVLRNSETAKISEALKVQNLCRAPFFSGCKMKDKNQAEKLQNESRAPFLGFEMEGVGACLLVKKSKTDILVVKGVSDQGDHYKNKPAPITFFSKELQNVDEDTRQQMCTMMSLMVVFRAIKAKWGEN